MYKKCFFLLFTFLFYVGQGYTISILDHAIDFITQTKWMKNDPVIGSMGLISYFMAAIFLGLFSSICVIKFLIEKNFKNVAFHSAMLASAMFGMNYIL
jgi:TRAP-type mannitol/chloroaromatic compound transport system permease small subunit